MLRRQCAALSSIASLGCAAHSHDHAPPPHVPDAGAAETASTALRSKDPGGNRNARQLRYLAWLRDFHTEKEAEYRLPSQAGSASQPRYRSEWLDGDFGSPYSTSAEFIGTSAEMGELRRPSAVNACCFIPRGMSSHSDRASSTSDRSGRSGHSGRYALNTVFWIRTADPGGVAES